MLKQRARPDEIEALEAAVREAAGLLPAQGPISVFIHHNPLHALEGEPFERAVREAGSVLGCEPYLGEDRFRELVAEGRISMRDIEAVLDEDPGSTGTVAGLLPRRELRRRVLVHGIPTVQGAALSWLATETDVLRRFRSDLPREAREAIAAVRGLRGGEAAVEEAMVADLWRASRAAIARSGAAPRPPANAVPIRHRDLLLATHGIDIDDWTRPLLVRFLAAFLDQGLARVSLPGRERGLHACFIELYGHRLATLVDRWTGSLPAKLASDRRTARDARGSIVFSLTELGVEAGEWGEYLAATALALRGYAGMVRQLEEHRDRVPNREMEASLHDHLAIQLLCERAALEHAARVLRLEVTTAGMRAALRPRLPAAGSNTEARAWRLFHLAQLAGIDAATLESLDARGVTELEEEGTCFDGTERRRLLQLAYERHLRHRLYDALVQHRPRGRSAPPAFQAIFCIDEREESFRRHLEEADAGAETLGAAGFFGVAMYYQGAGDAHPRPQCPAALQPRHVVSEVVASTPPSRTHRAVRQLGDLLGHNAFLASRTSARGAALAAVLGSLALVPLVLRVLFPRLSSRMLPRARHRPGRGRLELESERGYTTEEMASIVHAQLEDCGLADRLAPLVVVVGHGSTSLNNPHESAHDCGACGGGRGGPNARAFSQMANRPDVRVLLRDRGIVVPEICHFVAAERNTANNAVELFDTDRVPSALLAAFRRAEVAFGRARLAEAHERCRRFFAIPLTSSAEAALSHVEARAADLAQPRPEYGHATSAFCIVGRRERTAGLFLDRRAFLVSYDPSRDATGHVLARLLDAVVPVVAGISLEYYFSVVDPTGYGCGTKLPHNVTALLGVMDGMSSDLRTGLPWQMVEIHEPVRLTVVVEADVEKVREAVAGNPYLDRLVRNRWISLASLDPQGGRVSTLAPGDPREHVAEHPLVRVDGGSLAWYRGKRGHLPPAALTPAPGHSSAA